MTTWVLLRGLTRESGHWGAFVDRMREGWPGCRVVALDLPGAGVLHAERCPARAADIARRCRDHLAAHAAAPPHRLLGLSLGGMVAAEWAAAWPGEVSHCVLINTSVRPHGSTLQRLRPAAWLPLAGLLCRRDPAAIERRILQWTSARPDAHADVLDAWIDIRRQRPVSRANAAAQLWAAARCRAPRPPRDVRTLVMCSAGDRLVDPACSRRLAAAWSCALGVHPDAGHDLPLDDPDWVVARIAAALDAESGRGRAAGTLRHETVTGAS